MQTDPTIDLKISALHDKAKQLLLEKKDLKEIVSELLKAGIEPFYAELVIENVTTELSNKRNFWIELTKGIIITIAGLILICLGYFTFHSEGVDVWLLYLMGVIVAGVSIIFRAFIIFRKNVLTHERAAGRWFQQPAFPVFDHYWISAAYHCWGRWPRAVGTAFSDALPTG